MPTIEPRPSIANAVIEDRNRAPSATLTHAQLGTPDRPHELSGLGAWAFPLPEQEAAETWLLAGADGVALVETGAPKHWWPRREPVATTVIAYAAYGTPMRLEGVANDSKRAVTR